MNVNIRGHLAWVVATAFIALAAPVAGAASAAPGSTSLTWTATVNGQEVKDQGSSSTIDLKPENGTPVTLDVTNDGDQPVIVHAVRLEGKILGLAFYRFTATTDLALAKGASGHSEFGLELADLEGQATGKIPSTFTLLDPQGNVLDSRPYVADVAGSLQSVYGIFGLAVGAITLVLLVVALVQLATGRLSRHRWLRATKFAVPGLGVGFVLTFTLSALSVLAPTPGTWTLLILLGAAVGFAVGYLTPTPETANPPQDRSIYDGSGRHSEAPTTPVGASASRESSAVLATETRARTSTPDDGSDSNQGRDSVP